MEESNVVVPILPAKNARGELETTCREDPRLGWPEFEESHLGPDHDRVWQTKCEVTFGNKKISAIVKAQNKKGARALAAEGVLRQIFIEKEKEPLPVEMVEKKTRKRNAPKKT